ncbi:MAG: hypothetical protein WC076_06705 [Terrimicrobiaceae bacterium]
MQVIQKIEKRIPRAVAVEDDGGLAFQVLVQRLVADKNRDRLEKILQRCARLASPIQKRAAMRLLVMEVMADSFIFRNYGL